MPAVVVFLVAVFVETLVITIAEKTAGKVLEK